MKLPSPFMQGMVEKRIAGGPLRDSLLQIFRSRDLRRLLPELAFSSLLTNLLSLALPMAILQIMDRVVTNKSLETLAYLILGILLALVIEEVLRLISGFITGWLGARFEHNTSVTAMEHMMRVPMRRYQREEPGAYTEKILAAGKVAEFYSGQALLVLFELPFVLIFLVIINIIGGWLVIVPVVLLLLFAFIIVHFGQRIRLDVDQRFHMDDRRLNFLAEVFANIHSVKTLMIENLLLRRYERLQEANAEKGAALTHGSSMAAGMGMLFSTILIVCVVFAGALVVLVGDMTPGGLAACMMLSVRALAPLRTTLSVWMRYQSFTAANQRLKEILDLPYENDEDKPDLPPVSQSLELRGVTVNREGGVFGFYRRKVDAREERDIVVTREGGAHLFSDLSLYVKAGECIGILGDSGSGKTTLMSLLSGMERPDSGEVLVDGRPIGEFNADSAHRQIALLPQAGTLVAGTILESMTMFNHKLARKALEIAREMGLDRVVANMKLGYETPLGDGGGESMSAGMRQLICIVRAMVQEPSVILFDEANIALDMESDTRLRKYLEKQKNSHTMILITHRPSMLLLADKIYTLVDGKLLEGKIEPKKKEAVAEQPVAAALERPGPNEDFSRVARQHFHDESDFSNCLLPLLNALEWEGSPRELVEALPHMVERLDLSGFCSVMTELGFLPRHFKHSLGHLDHRFMPCLFIPAAKPAMIILARLPDGRLRAFDGASRKEMEIGLIDGLEGEVYFFNEEEKGEQKSVVEINWLANLAWRLRRHIALIFVFSVLSTVLALAPPMFVMAIYDRVLPTGDVGMGALILAGVSIAIILDWSLRVLKSRVMAHIGGRTEYILGTGVLGQIINLPATSTSGASVSRQVGRIKNIESLRDFFLGPLALLIFDFPASLVMLAALAFLNPWVVGVVVVSSLAFSLLWFATRGVSERSSSRVSQFSALRWEFLEEALTNMRAIRSVGASKLWVERFRKLSGKAVMSGFHDRQVQARISGVAQFLGTATGILSLAVSAILVIYGGLSGGAIIATMMMVWRLTGPMQSTFLAVTSMMRTRSTIRQVENLMKLKGEHEGGVHTSLRPDIAGEISFARVSFRYANDADPALLGISFTIKPCQMVVITGPSGSGKSSLLKLIIRVFIPQAGTIRLDNVDIRQLVASDLRSRISYMPQNCEIFYGTVTQNIRLVHPSATHEEIEWALEMAGVADFARGLPQGLNTRISNSQSEQLPRGFRQSLSLARVILKPAPVVLMDEPGNGMDEAGERALIRCIEWLRGKTTILMISQRPAHMRLADAVIYMERGAIGAMGPFEQIKDQLMAGLRK